MTESINRTLVSGQSAQWLIILYGGMIIYLLFIITKAAVIFFWVKLKAIFENLSVKDTLLRLKTEVSMDKTVISEIDKSYKVEHTVS